MPAYDFVCDNCGHVHEVNVKAEWRNSLNLDCPECGTRLRRKISLPMAEIWGGKFGSRALKKQDNDGYGREW